MRSERIDGGVFARLFPPRMELKLYSREWCSWCMDAKEYLSERGYKFIEIDVGQDRQAYEEMKQLSEQTYVPTFVAGGKVLEGDRVVWACGAWLPALFPGLVDLRVTQQDVLYFGADAAWRTPPVPTWVDYDAAAYGVGDVDGRGVKVCSDVEGPPFDVDGDRVPLVAQERRGRSLLASRFPALAGAPLVGTRVCQYELTTDTRFLIAPHPDHPERVWLLGGGSGHGFKHGPAVGQMMADLILKEREPAAIWRLERFALASSS